MKSRNFEMTDVRASNRFSPSSNWNLFRISDFGFRVFLLLFAFTLPASAEDTIKSKVVDPDNHSVTETLADTKGRIIKKTRFFFDDNNWSKGAIHFGEKDVVKYKEVFKRDAGGRLLETRLFDKDDKSLGKRVCQYDGSGKLLRIDDYDAADRLLTPAQRAVPVKRKK